MVNKIKKIFSGKKEHISKENKSHDEYSISRVVPHKTFLFGKVLSFSLDSHSIQMAASFHYGRSFRIIDVHKDYFIQDEEKSKQIEDFYEQCIHDFTKKHSSWLTKTFITLSGQSTLYRTFLLPQLNSKDLSSAVQFEVKKIIPFPIEESIYDYRVIQKIEDIENNRVKVSLHATTKSNIQKQLDPFQKQNIRIDKILHSQDTIGQLLGRINDFDINMSYILINIGRRVTEISFYHGSTLEFSRSTELTTDMLGSSGGTTKLEYFAEVIANEIQNSLDFYSGQINSSSNNQIMLYGDFAYSNEFISIINDKLEINLARFPIDKLNISYDKGHDIESFPVCLPVFATSVNYSKLPDLLPLPLKQKRFNHKVNMYLKTAAALVLISLSSSWIYTSSSLDTMQNKQSSLKKQIQVFEESEAFHSYKMIKQEIAYDRLYIDLAKEAPSYMHLNLKELSHLTPENIKLFYLDYNPKEEAQNYFIQGIVRSTDIPPEITLAEFIENLSASQFYEDVQIIRHVKKKSKSYFEIEFLIKMKGIV